LKRSTAEDVICYFLTPKTFCQCCGLQLRTTPAHAKQQALVRGVDESDVEHISTILLKRLRTNTRKHT
jgi:hypothetical protein